MGFFRPDLADQALAALDMMQFEGIEQVRERVSQNGTMYQMIQQMREQMLQMATIIDASNGSSIAPNMAASFQQGGGVTSPASGGGAEPSTNALGDTLNKARGGTAGAARAKAASASTPRA